MLISIAVHLAYDILHECDLLLQIEAASLPDQAPDSSELAVLTANEINRIPADGGIGERIWVHADTSFECRYTAAVQVQRSTIKLEHLHQEVLPTLPGDVVGYLMPSRYCHPEKFHDFVVQNFEGLSGGVLIAAARDWINRTFDYVPGASDSGTTAHDTLRDRRGVCRDYAHVLITIARASAIPARIVSVYAPDLTPQDFHAVAEVYLSGAWHLVDATGMAKTEDMVRIGVGRDAADVSFITAYGNFELRQQSVRVVRSQ